MSKKYRVTLSDGRTFAVTADAPPSEADVMAALGQQKAPPPAREPGFDVERADPNAAPLNDRLAARVAETDAADARTQGNNRMGEYAAETIGNIPRDLKDQAGGVLDMMRTAGGAVGEFGLDVGSAARGVVGLDPYWQNGRPNQEALKQVPGLMVQHFGDYLDSDKRALMVREHPVGLALDVEGLRAAGQSASSGVRSAASSARNAVSMPRVAAVASHPMTRAAGSAAMDVITSPTPIGLARGAMRIGREFGRRAEWPTESPAAKTPKPPAGPKPRLVDSRIPSTITDELDARLDAEAGTAPPSDLPPGGLSKDAIESRIEEANAHADAGIERQRLNRERHEAELANAQFPDAVQPEPAPPPGFLDMLPSHEPAPPSRWASDRAPADTGADPVAAGMSAELAARSRMVQGMSQAGRLEANRGGTLRPGAQAPTAPADAEAAALLAQSLGANLDALPGRTAGLPDQMTLQPSHATPTGQPPVTRGGQTPDSLARGMAQGTLTPEAARAAALKGVPPQAATAGQPQPVASHTVPSQPPPVQPKPQKPAAPAGEASAATTTIEQELDARDPMASFRDTVARQTAEGIRSGQRNVWQHVDAVPIDANKRAVGQPGGSILEAGTPLPELMAEREMLLRTKPGKVTPEITARVDVLSRAIRQRNHISADMPGRYTSRPGGQ